MLVAAALGACSSPTSDGSADVERPDAAQQPTSAGPSAHIEGTRVVLDLDGDPQVLVAVEDAELVHASVRPGDDEPTTVLVLLQREGRYELRYLDVVDGEATDLYGLPFRLQVTDDVLADTPPIPVWSPDGDRVAWIEATSHGTRLRTLGWLTYERGTNPSEDRGDWDLAAVPTGTQLQGWRTEPDGTPLLLARPADGERWQIRLEDDGPIEALGAGLATS